eukprot:8450241-Lingulodinium_polyedra.AAC.1
MLTEEDSQCWQGYYEQLRATPARLAEAKEKRSTVPLPLSESELNDLDNLELCLDSKVPQHLSLIHI